MKEKMFLSNINVRVLIYLNNTKKQINMSVLSKDVDTTHSYIQKIVRNLTKKGLLSSLKIGKERIVSLTKKGEII